MHHDSGELDCEITEAVPPGYEEDYESYTGIDSDNGFDGCRWENIFGGEDHSCDIWNYLQQVRVDVTKLWFDPKPEFNNPMYAHAYYSCVNEQFSDVSGTLWFYGVEDDDYFYVYPHWNGLTTCTVDENSNQSGVITDDSDCSSLSVTPGVGNECTITNTRFYEGCWPC